MARNKATDGKPVEEGNGIEHNSASRKKIMSECAHQMREIKSQRAELNEQASDIRSRLRDNGIDVKSFEAALRLADMEDEGARDVYIDGLREAFAALGIGQQLSMFDGDDDGDDVRPAFLKDKHATHTEVGNA